MVEKQPIIVPAEAVKRPAAIGSFGQLFLETGMVIWRTEGLQQALIDVMAIRELISATNKITQNSVCPMMIDLSGEPFPQFTPTARAAAVGNDFVKRRTAIAFCITNEKTRTIYRQIAATNKFNIPFKAFETETECLQWLAGFLMN